MSKLKTTEEPNKSQNKVIEVNCLSCKRNTNHVVSTSLDIISESLSHDYDFWASESYQILRCLGCRTISFRSTSMNSEDTDYDEEENTVVNFVTELLYPKRNGRNPLKDMALLPVNVQRIYEETIAAMNNSQPVLAGIGIRAIVETVCKNKKANGNNLLEKIDSLATLGLLTLDGAEILHKIRTLGNDAAHEVKPHKPDQLALAMDVCEHLLLGVYLLPHYATQTFK